MRDIEMDEYRSNTGGSNINVQDQEQQENINKWSVIKDKLKYIFFQ